MTPRVTHTTNVVAPSRRLSAAFLTLTVLLGNAGVCAGWMPSAQARMACCTDEAQCPMHKRGSSPRAHHHDVSQEAADACCTMSEGEPAHSSPVFTVVIPSAVLRVETVLPAETPARALRDAWREPVPLGSTPKYVLFSVFLV
jgi:hypothetical protein